MTDLLNTLWLQGNAPGRDGLYHANGEARAVEIDNAALERFELGEPIALDDPEDVMWVDTCARVELAGCGALVCGDGAHGSEGFFARTNSAGELVWIVPLRVSNPFESISVEGSSATFTNNLGNSVTIDLNSPDF